MSPEKLVPRVAVVGHVEWVQFGHVAHVPQAGEIVHASDPFEEPAGGGAVAAVQLARLAGDAMLLTALGQDAIGASAAARLTELGVQVHAAPRSGATRRAVTLVDRGGERTITTFGGRLEPVQKDQELPWSVLGEMDAVYVTAADPGAMLAARAAKVLVASPRAGDALGAPVTLDALVLSTKDALERQGASHAQAQARLVVITDGGHGGTYRERSGDSGSWEAAPAPGPPVDSYGCGDSFAAGLTYGLGAGLSVPDALALAARCGAMCLTGRGPYERQLSDLDPAAGRRG
jgi:ribokinase